MTTNQLTQAKVLDAEIQNLTQQKSWWEVSVKFTNSSITTSNEKKQEMSMRTDLIDFDLVRSATLTKINSKLQEAEEKFAAL